MGERIPTVRPDIEVSQKWPPLLVELYGERFTELVRLAYLMTGSSAVAEELVQDSFVRAQTTWDRVRDPLPYVRASVVNACRGWHRHQRVARLHAATTLEPSTDEPDELWDALGRLAPQRRAAVVLRYYADLPHGEIARILGCRPTTVRTSIHRALRQLRQEIKP